MTFRCSVVAIGTELLLGQIVDTNSSWIGEQLALAGINNSQPQAEGAGCLQALRRRLTRMYKKSALSEPMNSGEVLDATKRVGASSPSSRPGFATRRSSVGPAASGVSLTGVSVTRVFGGGVAGATFFVAGGWFSPALGGGVSGEPPATMR